MERLPRGLLLLSPDINGLAVKTTEVIAATTRAMGIPTWVRDTTDLRVLSMICEPAGGDPVSLQRARTLRETWHRLCSDHAIDTVLSLDAHWFLGSHIFLDHPSIQRIFSIWFDDPRSWCACTWNAFWDTPDAFQEAMRHPKVLHAFYGTALAKDAELLGWHNQIVSMLAAPPSYLRDTTPHLFSDRAAFIGNPGPRFSPLPHLVECIRDGAELLDVRRIIRENLITYPDSDVQRWSKQEPSLMFFLSTAFQLRSDQPYDSVIQIIRAVGEHFPATLEFVDSHGLVPTIAFWINSILAFDRPALVSRLYSKGLLHVYSNEEDWAVWGVRALPAVPPHRLCQTYRSHLVHVNAANGYRGANANEKLFEISASGRALVNLASPDVHAAYTPGIEIETGETFAQIEEKLTLLLQDPTRASRIGKAARTRTAREHLWQHRLQTLFATEMPSL